jgi:hypothetical protein
MPLIAKAEIHEYEACSNGTFSTFLGQGNSIA